MHILFRPVIAFTCGIVTYGVLNTSLLDFAIQIELKKSFFVTMTACYITYIAYHDFE
jgi:hypothetical protein